MGLFDGALFPTIRNPVWRPQPKCHQSPMPTREHMVNLRLISDSDYYDTDGGGGQWWTDVDDRTGLAYTYWVEWGTWAIGDEDVTDA